MLKIINKVYKAKLKKKIELYEKYMNEFSEWENKYWENTTEKERKAFLAKNPEPKKVSNPFQSGQFVKTLKKETKREIKHLGSGVARTCYDLKNGKILKVARGPSGINCNRQEYKIWQIAPKKTKNVLADCFYISEDGVLLVQKKVCNKKKNIFSPREIDKSIKSKFERNLPLKLKWDYWHNWGDLGGKPKIYDYATQNATWSFKTWSDQEVEETVKELFKKKCKRKQR